MKNNKVLSIPSIIILLLIIIMSIYIIYNRVNEKDNDNQNNNISENNISKLDNTKDWIYDADYYLPTNKESYYGYSDHTKLVRASDLIVPYININTEDAKKVNKDIYEIYENLIEKFNDNLKEEISFTLVEYETYTKDNAISILITTISEGSDVPYYEYYTYNFNLDNGKLLSYEETYNIADFNETNIEEKITQSITNTMKKEYSNITNLDIYINKSINNYKTLVNEKNIKFFIDENKKLNIIVALEIPVGVGKFDKIITVE